MNLWHYRDLLQPNVHFEQQKLREVLAVDFEMVMESRAVENRKLCDFPEIQTLKFRDWDVPERRRCEKNYVPSFKKPSSARVTSPAETIYLKKYHNLVLLFN